VRDAQEEAEDMRDTASPAEIHIDPQQVWRDAVDEALNDVYIGDDDSHNRLAAFEWLDQGCDPPDVDV
jgi:hypothetical protein